MLFRSACNELPEIKGEDTALWRRIRAIEFPSRFVDDPKEPHEYKIDRTLPSRMREDLTWRQTFMNILLRYYRRENIPEPDEVKIKTNEYRQENNDFYNWMDENIIYSENPNKYIELKQVGELYYGTNKKINSRILTKLKVQIEKYIKEKYKDIDHNYEKKTITINGETKRIRSWINLELAS